MSVTVNNAIVPPTVPADFCPVGTGAAFWQAVINLMAQSQLSISGTLTNLVISATTPGADQRSNAWLRLAVADSSPIRLYKWALGYWVSQNPIQQDGRRWPYVGTEASVWSIDEGDGTDPSVAGNVTAVSGAMWQVDHTFDGRFPLGAGNLPSGTAVAQGSTGGNDQVTMIEANLPPHQHVLALTGPGDSGIPLPATPPGVPGSLGVHATNLMYTSGNPGIVAAMVNNGNGTSKPLNSISPYVGLFFIQRTARVHYRV